MDSDGERSTGSGQDLTGTVTEQLRVEEVRQVAEVVGIVVEQLPSRLYQVKLEGGGLVTAHIADRMDRNFVRVLVGDRVRLELSPLDSGRGRIVGKL